MIDTEVSIHESLRDFNGDYTLDRIAERARDPLLRGIALAGQFGAGKTFVADILKNVVKGRNIRRLLLDNSIRRVKTANPQGFDGSLHGGDQFEYFSTIGYFSDIKDYIDAIDRPDPEALVVFETGVGKRDEGNSTIMQLEENGFHLLVVGIVADGRNIYTEQAFRRSIFENQNYPENIPTILEEYHKKLDDKFDMCDPKIWQTVIDTVLKMAKWWAIQENNEEVFLQAGPGRGNWDIDDPLYLASRKSGLYLPADYLGAGDFETEQMLRATHMEYHLEGFTGTETQVHTETIPTWNIFQPNRFTRLNLNAA